MAIPPNTDLASYGVVDISFLQKLLQLTVGSMVYVTLIFRLTPRISRRVGKKILGRVALWKAAMEDHFHILFIRSII